MPNGTAPSRRRTPPALTVDDIIRARPEVRELTVRSVGPACVFIVECDAPPRLEHNARTESERQRLHRYLEDDPRANHFAAAWGYARSTPNGLVEDTLTVERTEAHGARLETGSQRPTQEGVSA